MALVANAAVLVAALVVVAAAAAVFLCVYVSAGLCELHRRTVRTLCDWKLYVTDMPAIEYRVFSFRKYLRRPCVYLLPLLFFPQPWWLLNVSPQFSITPYDGIISYKSPNRMPTKRVFINNQSLKYALKCTHAHTHLETDSNRFITQYHSKYPKQQHSKHDRDGILHSFAIDATNAVSIAVAVTVVVLLLFWFCCLHSSCSCYRCCCICVANAKHETLLRLIKITERYEN